MMEEEGSGASLGENEELVVREPREDPHEDDTGEEEPFDITLAATHSYMGEGLVAVGGRSVLEAGWVGRVPCTAHRGGGAVFPGETVPMLLPHPRDAALLSDAIKKDKLFGLVFPDENGDVFEYGVLCEVFEAALPEDRGRGSAPGSPAGPAWLSVKARATQRFRLEDKPTTPVSINVFNRVVMAGVVVAGEAGAREPLRAARLAGLPPHSVASLVRRLEAVSTSWPRFLFDLLDYRRLRARLHEHFASMALDKLPEDPVSLSYWVASNLELSTRERLALFATNDALLRLYMESELIDRQTMLCCASCGADVSSRSHALAMSSDGLHSNYTNLGGYMHDVVTVSHVTGARLVGAASDEFSWFPGYAWTIAVCGRCGAHLGWRFDAMKRRLRPQRFFGVTRSAVRPADRPRDAAPPLAAQHTR